MFDRVFRLHCPLWMEVEVVGTKIKIMKPMKFLFPSTPHGAMVSEFYAEPCTRARDSARGQLGSHTKM